jgi:hypothetical protein
VWIASGGGPVFFSHRHHTIVSHTKQCVSYYPLTATDHGHTMQLFFTHLLRKTSVIDPIKVKKRKGSEVGTLLLNLLLNLFSPRSFFSPELEVSEKKKILKRNSAEGGKRAGSRGRPPNTNFQQVDGSTFFKSIMNRHHIRMRTIALLACDESKRVSLPSSSQCTDFSHLTPTQLCSQETFSHTHALS